MRAKLKHAREREGLSTLYLYTSYSTVITAWHKLLIWTFNIGTHTITTEKTLLSQSPQINTYVCIISRLLVTITWCRFSRLHNQHFAFIDRFHPSYNTKSYNFHAPTLVTSAYYKSTAKMRYFLPEITAFDEETTLCHTFLYGDLQCLPPGDPRILCA